MKKSTRRSRRQRNPKQKEGEQQPSFFSKSSDKVQTKEESNFFQPKLEVSSANDPQEKEADAVANKVVQGAKQQASAGVQKKEKVNRMAEQEEKPKAKLQRMAEEEKSEEATPKLQKKEMEEDAKPKLQRMDKEDEANPKLQRMAREEEARPKLQRMEKEDKADAKLQRAAKEEEAKPKLQKKEDEKEAATKLQTKETTDEQDEKKKASTATLEQMLKESKGKGFALPFDVRTEMEAEFNVDFSEVRIHTDMDAIEMCEMIKAQAFAHGFHIYFNQGKYNPDTDTGKNLLAHELTHVVQQKGG